MRKARIFLRARINNINVTAYGIIEKNRYAVSSGALNFSAISPANGAVEAIARIVKVQNTILKFL